MPELDFVVEGAEVALHSVSPLLAFKLRVTNRNRHEEIASLALHCQIQVEATRRGYEPVDQARLAELFGEPQRWSQTLRTLLWTHANAAVPAFSGTCAIDLPVPCSFDFNVASTKYFNALEGGEIPLMLQFSGTIFYREDDGTLQVARVPWHKEAAFRLPVATWRAMRDYYYPNSAWLCVQREVFERLERYRIERGLSGCDDALSALLDHAHGEEPVAAHGRHAMNAIDGIVQAVLYEGYMLYPYRASSVKNRQRWTFGSVYPRAWAEHSGGEAWMMQTECLIEGGEDARVTVRPSFLHLVERDVRELEEALSTWTGAHDYRSRPVASLEVDGRRFDAWQEASEQRVEAPALSLGELCNTGSRLPFSLQGSRALEPLMHADGRVRGILVRTRAAIDGRVECCAARLGEGTFRLTVRIVNVTPVDEPQRLNRDAASAFALLSCHAVLAVEGAGFVSSIDPPEELAEAVGACRNIGLWPVLVGPEARHDTMLAAPIILYDYPQVAPESAGDLFDATEIDEILTLRILTMTDAEKREMAAGDERSRALLERTERLSAADLQRLHGTLREVRVDTGWTQTPEQAAPAFDDPVPWAELEAKPRLACVSVGGVALQVGSRVVLHPRARADIFDLALRDQVATIESIERDFEDHVHVAVTIDCDPGRDFGLARMPGHRFFFAPDEIEPLREERPS